MSDIAKVKQATDQLSFLNSEIGRVTGKLEDLQFLEKELSIKLDEARSNFDKEINSNSTKLQDIEKQINIRTNELAEIKEKIESSIKEHDTFISKINEAYLNLKTIEDRHISISNIIESKSIDADKRLELCAIKEASLQDREFKIQVSENEIRNKLDGIGVEATELMLQREEFDRRLSTLDAKEMELNNKEQLLVIRENDIDEKFRKLKSEQFVLDDARNSFESTKKEIEKREKQCENIERAQRIKEEEIRRRDEASIKREADTTLREAECRIRERKLNIQLQENQLQ